MKGIGMNRLSFDVVAAMPLAIQSRPCKRSPNAGSASFHEGVFAYEHHRSPDSISGSSDHPRVSVEGRSLALGV